MKVIFLDIDGVMVTEKSVRGYHDTERFLPSAVENLDDIVRRTGAKIVITNTWRIGNDVSNIQRIFKRNGMRNSRSIIGTTARLSDYNVAKSKEINKWISDSKDIDGYVVIDDTPINDLAANQVLVNSVDGIAAINVNDVVRRLR